MSDSVTLSELSVSAIQRGSKTFSLAARLFPREQFEGATKIYFWCRHCDDVIDSQKAGQDEVEDLILKTFHRSDEPQFLVFKEVCEKYQIPEHYPRELLEGMRMDVEGRSYQRLEDLKLYCYRVAGTVGLMMSHVMGLYNQDALSKAAQLGMGMQLTNIARDIKEDYERGRIYLPMDWLQIEGLSPENLLDVSMRGRLFSVVKRLLLEADEMYLEAKKGVFFLPLKNAFAVTVAANFYREIGREILRRGPEALDRRVVVSNPRKWTLLLSSCLEVLRSLPKRIFTKQKIVTITRTWSLE